MMLRKYQNETKIRDQNVLCHSMNLQARLLKGKPVKKEKEKRFSVNAIAIAQQVT